MLWIAVFLPCVLANYTVLYDSEERELVVRDGQGTCLSLHLQDILVLNRNTNETIPLDLSEASLSGACAVDRRGAARVTATVTHGERSKTLTLHFDTKNVVVKQFEELRWQMNRLVYEEEYEGQSVVFSTTNSSSVSISAPLNQKFVCRDKINATLISEEGYQDVIVIFTPNIDIQPYGLKSNLYVCERTRKRTLSESLDSRSTVLSGVVLGLSAVGSIIYHAFRRHNEPDRKQQYLNLGQ